MCRFPHPPLIKACLIPWAHSPSTDWRSLLITYYRSGLRCHAVKRLHYTTYIVALIMFVHGTLIDQYMPGAVGQVLIEMCCLIVVSAPIWRRLCRARTAMPDDRTGMDLK